MVLMLLWNVHGADQLCSGLCSGIEGAIHGKREVFEETAMVYYWLMPRTLSIV